MSIMIKYEYNDQKNYDFRVVATHLKSLAVGEKEAFTTTVETVNIIQLNLPFTSISDGRRG